RARALFELTSDLAGALQTETMRSWCDNAEAFDLLGWRPCVELEEGIRRTASANAHANSNASAVATKLPPLPVTASQGT
ncbi:hypothetical protein ACVBEH_24985, partial [Roseateles sp. GG27B]